jgi:hypothetical protein
LIIPAGFWHTLIRHRMICTFIIRIFITKNLTRFTHIIIIEGFFLARFTTTIRAVCIKSNFAFIALISNKMIPFCTFLTVILWISTLWACFVTLNTFFFDYWKSNDMKIIRIEATITLGLVISTCFAWVSTTLASPIH